MSRKKNFIRAISERNLDGVNNFIRRDGDVNGFKHMRMTALIYALHTCQPSESGTIDEIISRLIDKGADVNAIHERSGMTATMLAMKKNRSDVIVLKFIDAGTDVGVICKHGKTTLIHALENNYGNPVISALIKNGSDVNIFYNDKTLFYYAVCVCKDPDIIEMVLNEGAIINISEFDKPLLALCCQESCKIDEICKYKRITDILIKSRVNIKERDSCGNTIIHLSSCNYVFFLAQRHGVSVNERNDLGETPLIQALICQDVYKVHGLLFSGADPNWRDSRGNTPLHYSDVSRNKSLVNLLIYHGANVLAEDNMGVTPLDLIVSDGRFIEISIFWVFHSLLKHYLLYHNDDVVSLRPTSVIDSNGESIIFLNILMCKFELDQMQNTLLKNDMSIYQFCQLKKFYTSDYIPIEIDQYLADHDSISDEFTIFKDSIFMRLKDNSRYNFKRNLFTKLGCLSVRAASPTDKHKLGYKLRKKMLYIIGKYLNYRQLYALFLASF